MEKQSLFREYFPGYMGHIPYKSEVIGMTVGATNNHIKSLLTKEPDYKAQLEPIPDEDYTYYNRRYFTKDISKAYPLEEDKIYSNRSKMLEHGFQVKNMFYIQNIFLVIQVI
jgi:hypothetical protein